MIGQSYETHIQCTCGGTLVIVAKPNDKIWSKTLEETNLNIWEYEEILTFRHEGPFVEDCLAFKKYAIEELQKVFAKQIEAVIKSVSSHNLHGL